MCSVMQRMNSEARVLSHGPAADIMKQRTCSPTLSSVKTRVSAKKKVKIVIKSVRWSLSYKSRV